jgi:hypothetical protein
VPFANYGYFYGTILDIVIALDRIANFNGLVKRSLQKLSPYKMCIVLFVFCFLVDLAYFFVFVTGSVTFDVIDANGKTIRGYVLWYADISAFAKSKVGTIVLYITRIS